MMRRVTNCGGGHMNDRSGNGRPDSERPKGKRHDEVAVTAEQIRRDLSVLKEQLLRMRERLDIPFDRRG